MTRAGRLLAAGLALAAAAAGPPSPSPAAARDAAARVFDRPEFRAGDPVPGWLLRQLRDFFAWLGGLHETAPVLFWLLLVGCVVVLVALVAHIAWSVRSVFAANRRGRAEDPAEAERRLLSSAYRQEADRRAEAGDYTEAVRFLFLSLVYRFDERGRVSLHRAYTNREYLDLLGDRAAVRDALRVMVDVLDDHWYGQRPCGPEVYRACRAVYDRLAV